LLNFAVNVLSVAASFAVSFWLPSKYTSVKRELAASIFGVSGIALYLWGPHAISFGSFLGSGWMILNEMANQIDAD
jgi:hypothetical protein